MPACSSKPTGLTHCVASVQVGASIATRWADARLAGRTADAWLSVHYRVADRLVFARLRSRFGGRLRFFVSGGAPLDAEINRFFYGPA